ncbi:MAG: ampG protein [Rickettsiaceae bacterium]|jgi:PAT family beta-lactamase induction signal transducer AmpG|nr:ampG protein [Rickettsiaceae bacterium]
MLLVWLIGLLSGLSLMITSSTLNFWLAKSGVSVVNIGLFAIVSLPYAINFLWAPFIDYFEIPYFKQKFGVRQSWIISLSLFLAIGIYMLSLLDPKENLSIIAFISIIISFFSSSLDVVLGALRSEMLKDKEHGPASGIYLFGYRLGMIISKSGAIYLSYYLEWAKIYHILLIILLTLIGCILYNIPHKDIKIAQKHNIAKSGIREFLKTILSPIGSIKFIIILLVFLILYRLPDNVLNNMISPFLLEIGFNEVEISLAGYLCGSIASIIGGMIAGIFIDRLGIYRSLLYFGGLHALGHMLFNLFGVFGKEIYLLSFVITIEGITGGMAMASYIALITSLCRGQYRGTQYSLFSAMMGVSRSLLPAFSGILVLQMGWSYFFFLVFILSLPSLYILRKYLVRIKAHGIELSMATKNNIE